MSNDPIEPLRKDLESLLTAIEECRSRNLALPMLILLYSGIDIMGSLESEDGRANGAAFRHWTEQYLLNEGELACTSDDLWGARCGILHTYSSVSDHSRAGKAKELVYSWGIAAAADLSEMVSATGRAFAAVHINSLVTALRRGVSRFLFELSNDQRRMAIVGPRAALWFTNVDKSVGDRFLEIVRRRPNV